MTTPSKPKRSPRAKPAAHAVAAGAVAPEAAAEEVATEAAEPKTPEVEATAVDAAAPEPVPALETSTAAEAPAPAEPARSSHAAQVLTASVVSTQPVTIEKGLAIQHGTPILPARHPNLGLAPAKMSAGFIGASRQIRADKTQIVARGLEEAVKLDRSLRTRYDDAGLRRFLHDGELLVERLAMSLGADDVRWVAEYCEWIGPIYRRGHVPLADLATLCAGIREALVPDLTEEELVSATRALDAADVVLRRNGRVAGDRHKRRAIFKWMYRGV